MLIRKLLILSNLFHLLLSEFVRVTFFVNSDTCRTFDTSKGGIAVVEDKTMKFTFSFHFILLYVMNNLNESIAFSSSWESGKMQFMEQRTCIVVAIANPRTRLRVNVLLSTVPEYQVRYITTEDEVSERIEEADMIIGTGIVAREGVMRRKPVIVLGDYGFGGLVTPNTFRTHFTNCFRGKVNGFKNDYFSLERLEEEIRKGFNLTYQELQMMSNQTLTFLNT